jgi:hypothetical protein
MKKAQEKKLSPSGTAPSVPPDPAVPETGTAETVETVSMEPTRPKPVSISAIELAHLTAELTQAHLVSGSSKEKVESTLEFLMYCAMKAADLEDLTRLSRYESEESRRIRPLVEKYAGTAIVPIQDVIHAAGLSELVLSPAEHKAIGGAGKFSTLSDPEKAVAIFRFLTQAIFVGTTVQTKGVKSIMIKGPVFTDQEKLKVQAECGVSLSDIQRGLLNNLRQAARNRERGTTGNRKRRTSKASLLPRDSDPATDVQ